ncbi:hypothetical protein AB1N83_011818 [Pleurotus pulmonarius]
MLARFTTHANLNVLRKHIPHDPRLSRSRRTVGYSSESRGLSARILERTGTRRNPPRNSLKVHANVSHIYSRQDCRGVLESVAVCERDYGNRRADSDHTFFSATTFESAQSQIELRSRYGALSETCWECTNIVAGGPREMPLALLQLHPRVSTFPPGNVAFSFPTSLCPRHPPNALTNALSASRSFSLPSGARRP